jgi:MtN3 and saliva related transmembrane protein
MDFSSYVGGLAAFLASLSYIPQVRKAWPRGATKDLSLGMLATLTLGLLLWILYGALKGDWVIVIANALGATLAGAVLGCKLRDEFQNQAKPSGQSGRVNKGNDGRS